MEIYTPLNRVKRSVFRLPGVGGVALFLLPIMAPGRSGFDENLVRNYDVALLSPDRKVEYLARTAKLNFISELANYLWEVANEIHPEKSVPHFQDTELGLGISVVSSNDFLVEVQISVVMDFDTTPLEFDSLNFETSRLALIGMNRDLKRFESEFADDEDCEDLP